MQCQGAKKLSDIKAAAKMPRFPTFTWPKFEQQPNTSHPTRLQHFVQALEWYQEMTATKRKNAVESTSTATNTKKAKTNKGEVKADKVNENRQRHSKVLDERPKTSAGVGQADHGEKEGARVERDENEKKEKKQRKGEGNGKGKGKGKESAVTIEEKVVSMPLPRGKVVSKIVDEEVSESDDWSSEDDLEEIDDNGNSDDKEEADSEGEMEMKKRKGADADGITPPHTNSLLPAICWKTSLIYI